MAYNISGGVYENIYNPQTQTYVLTKISGSGPAIIGSSEGGTYTTQAGQQQTQQQAIASGQIDNPQKDIKFQQTAQAAQRIPPVPENTLTSCMHETASAEDRNHGNENG